MKEEVKSFTDFLNEEWIGVSGADKASASNDDSIEQKLNTLSRAGESGNFLTLVDVVKNIYQMIR